MDFFSQARATQQPTAVGGQPIQTSQQGAPAPVDNAHETAVRDFAAALTHVWTKAPENELASIIPAIVAPSAVIHNALAIRPGLPVPYGLIKGAVPVRTGEGIDLCGPVGFETYVRSLRSAIPNLFLDVKCLAWTLADPTSFSAMESQAYGYTAGRQAVYIDAFAHFTKRGVVTGPYLGRQPLGVGKEGCANGIVRFRLELLPRSSANVAFPKDQQQGALSPLYARILEEWLFWDKDEFSAMFANPSV